MENRCYEQEAQNGAQEAQESHRADEGKAQSRDGKESIIVRRKRVTDEVTFLLWCVR